MSDVFSRPECIFNYCPHPENCKESCLAPAGPSHVKGTIEHPAEPEQEAPQDERAKCVCGHLEYGGHLNEFEASHPHDGDKPTGRYCCFCDCKDYRPAEPVIEVAPGEYERCAVPAQVAPREKTLHEQLFEETEKIDQMCDDEDWHTAVCLFESAVTRVFTLRSTDEPAEPQAGAQPDATIQCIHCPHVEQWHTSGVVEGTKRGCLSCNECPGFERAGAQVPSRVVDVTPETIRNYLYGIENRALNEYQHTGNTEYLGEALTARIQMKRMGYQSDLTSKLEVRLNSIKSYATEAAKTPITRESILAAPQDGECAHAPEIPVKLFRFPGIDHLFVAREDYLKLELALAAMTEDRDLWRCEHEGDCPVQAALESERESRKQAEAERDRALEIAAKWFRKATDQPLMVAENEVRKELSKPVLEPAERVEEREK
jgi:hypothetical protein